MGKHGLSSCEYGVDRAPKREKILEKDKATFDEPEAMNVTDDQDGSGETSESDATSADG